MASLIGPLASARYRVRAATVVLGLPVYLHPDIDHPSVGLLERMPTMSYHEAQELRRGSTGPVVVEYAARESYALAVTTGDDSVFCGLCGKETSLVMIARHLKDEHGIDPDWENVPIVDGTL